MKSAVVAFLRFVRLDGLVWRWAASRAWVNLWKSSLRPERRLCDNGFCVAVDFRSFDSIAQLGRDFVEKMRLTAISFDLFEMHIPYLGCGMLAEKEVESLLCESVSQIRHRHVLCFCNKPMPTIPELDYSITPFWEFQEGLPEVNPHLFDGKRHLVVFSDFCLEYFKKIAPHGVSVHKIRYPYAGTWRVTEDRATVRRRYGIPDSDFSVFFHFNLGSSVERKNPQGALAAFQKAYSSNDKVYLVLKVAGMPRGSAEYRQLEDHIRACGLGDRVTLINERLDHDGILNLIAAADVYMSLHRGEGFGIGMLEAMSVGTPVVCTNYGGNTEFCRPETAFLVDYDMVANMSGEQHFRFVRRWPEPRVDQAAEYLRQLYANPEMGRAKAAAASVFIADYFSDENFKQDVVRFMHDIGCGNADR